MTVANTRAARHGLIERLLRRSGIGSQTELQKLLARHGVDVTQATVSRDLEQMRVVKVRGPDGDMIYALPGLHRAHVPPGESVISARLERWCRELLQGADHASNLCVVRTPPGAAQLLGSAIDQSDLPGVLGTIGGDDTIMIITRDDAAAADIATTLLDLASSTAAPNP